MHRTSAAIRSAWQGRAGDARCSLSAGVWMEWLWMWMRMRMQSGTVQAPSLAQDGSRVTASEG